jgi:hypothetical protein
VALQGNGLLKPNEDSEKKGTQMRPLTRWLSSFILLAPAFCGCRASSPAKPPKPLIEEIPSQIMLRLQVIALREKPDPAAEAPFPALGFQFAGDRIVPVESPDTIAGVELTAPQLNRWMANLAKAGAALYAEPVFTVGPNLPATSVFSTEKGYQSNWRVNSNGASPENAGVVPESKFTVQPELVPGTRDLLTSVEAEISAADLDPFTLVDNFAAKGLKAAPLALLLPRQTLLRMATQTMVRPGQSLVLAHYVKQYRAAPQPSGPEENLRDHIFYLLSAERRGPQEAPSDLPIVPRIPPRYALTLTWLESRNAAPTAQSPQRANPAPGDWDALVKMARGLEGDPDAVAQTLSLALTANTQAQFEVAEERGYVAGIHPDSAEAASPYDFLIHQTWTGMKLSAQLEPAPQGVSAALNLRLADPPQFRDAVGKLPSLQPGAPETEGAEYHLQSAAQTSAEFAATEILRPGQIRLLRPTWQTTGAGAAPNARRRAAAVILQETAAPPAETPPQASK